MAEGCQWELVYRHGPNGDPLFGTIRGLVLGISTGADVQVGYHRPGNIRWFRHCPSVSIRRGEREGTFFENFNNAIVSAVVSDIPSTDPTSDGRDFSPPPAYEWKIFNTSGFVQTLKFTLPGDKPERQTDRIGLSWFLRGHTPAHVNEIERVLDHINVHDLFG